MKGVPADGRTFRGPFTPRAGPESLVWSQARAGGALCFLKQLQAAHPWLGQCRTKHRHCSSQCLDHPGFGGDINEHLYTPVDHNDASVDLVKLRIYFFLSLMNTLIPLLIVVQAL